MRALQTLTLNPLPCYLPPQARALTHAPTLPKRLMPVSLASVKKALFSAITSPLAAATARAFTTSAAPAAAPSSPTAGSSTSSLPAASAFLDGPAAAPGTTTTTTGSRRTGGGAGVLDLPRPTPGKQPSPPGLGAPGAPLPPFPGSSSIPTLPGLSTRSPKPRSRPGGGAGPKPNKGPIKNPGPGLDSREGLAPGSWAPGKELPLGKRERELRERRAYLKNFWWGLVSARRPLLSVLDCSPGCPGHFLPAGQLTCTTCALSYGPCPPQVRSRPEPGPKAGGGEGGAAAGAQGGAVQGGGHR